MQIPGELKWAWGETLTFCRLPRAHHQHPKSINLWERLNGEIKRRTRVVRIFPNIESCLRLIWSLCVGTHESWLEDNRDLNIDCIEGAKERMPESGSPMKSTPMPKRNLHNLGALNPRGELLDAATCPTGFREANLEFRRMGDSV